MFFSTLLMIGCQSEQSFELDEEYYNSSNALVEINNEKLRSLEKEKGSFAVFVYLPNCATSTEFNNMLMEFLEKKQMSFYKISGLDNKALAKDILCFCPPLKLVPFCSIL